MSSKIGERIRSIRNEHGLSMEEFGKLFSPPASKGVVSNWENDYNLPNNARLAKIATLGNISVPYLLYGGLIEDTKRFVLNRINQHERSRDITLINLESAEIPSKIEQLEVAAKNTSTILRAYRNNFNMLKLIEKDLKEGKTIENLEVLLEDLKHLHNQNIEIELEPLPENINFRPKIEEKQDIATLLENSDKVTYKGFELTEESKKLIIDVLKGLEPHIKKFSEK